MATGARYLDQRCRGCYPYVFRVLSTARCCPPAHLLVREQHANRGLPTTLSVAGGTDPASCETTGGERQGAYRMNNSGHGRRHVKAQQNGDKRI